MGTFRFILAFFVAISHLWAGMLGGPAAYAVWGFFVLSGFLMTEILRNKYGFTVQGLQKYVFNRFLRIFPLYYMALITGIITIFMIPNGNISLIALNPQFSLPNDITNWIATLFLLPFGAGNNPVPVAGALAVEVGVYILIPFMAVNRSAAWLGAILSLLVSLKYGIDLTTFASRYSEFLTAYFAFAIGSLTNHYKIVLAQIAMPKTSTLIWLGYCLLISKFLSTWPWTYGLYMSTFFTAWVVISIYKVQGTSADTFLGDLSYPVYLFHTTVAAWMLLFFDASRSFAFFFISFILTLVLSWILLIIIDRPLQRRKKRAIPDTDQQITVDEYLGKIIGHLRVLITHRISVKILVGSAIIGAIAVVFVSYRIYANHNLKIHAWGPQNTPVGQIPNLQPDGNGGLWIKTDLTVGLGRLEIQANGKPLNTVVSSHLITATLPKELFHHQNLVTIEVIQIDTDHRYAVGTLRVDVKQ